MRAIYVFTVAMALVSLSSGALGLRQSEASHGTLSSLYGASPKEITESIIKKLFGLEDPGEKCEKQKKKNVPVSAEDGISPAKVFGYPSYDSKINVTKVSPGVSLSHMFGHFQPIKIGLNDFFIQGDIAEVGAFFKCFENYKVKGAYLASNGRWSDKPSQHHSIFMQVQNIENTNMNMNVAEFVIREALEKVTKALNPSDVVGSQLENLTGTNLLSYFEKLQKLAGTYPVLKSMFEKVKDIVSSSTDGKKKTRKEVAVELLNYLLGRSQSQLRDEKWENPGAVNLKKRVEVKITMYPSQSHGVRSTYKFDGGEIEVKDLGEAFDILVAQSPLKELL